MLFTKTGSKEEIEREESRLISKGYSQVDKSNSKDLRHKKEYIKTSYSGTPNSFKGPIMYRLEWLE